MHGRPEHTARNEAMFRQLNETIEQVAMRGRIQCEVAFLCECGDDLCGEEIRLSLLEYERVRAKATRFLVKPDHFDPEIDVVAEQHDRYWIVEKTHQSAEAARDSDPRSTPIDARRMPPVEIRGRLPRRP